MLSAQVGFGAAENLSLRGNLDSLFLVNTLSGDVLYSFSLEDLTAYAGAGPDMVVLFGSPPDSEYPRVFFGIHGTVGAEYRQASLGYFLELQPGLAFLGESQVYLRTRIGVNAYF